MNIQSNNFKRKIWIVFIFALFPVFLFSQVESVWVRRYDGPVNGEDVAKSMVVDKSGNVYVTGWSDDLHNLNVAPDCATIKYDTEGNELWVARYNYGSDWEDWCNDIVLDSSGNVCVTGATQSAYMIGTFKYDNHGSGLWGNGYVPPLYQDNWGSAIVVDPIGNVYVAAFGCSPESGYRVIKYHHSSGNILWDALYAYGGGYDFPCLAIDNQNNLFIAGQDCEHYLEYLLIKYNETGSLLWKKVYDNQAPGDDRIHAIVVDDYGNVYVTGQSLGVSSGYDYATIKYDNDGNQLWVARYNGPGNGEDRANAITVDNFGNVYVAGISEGDYATVKYDSAGTEQWVETYDGLGNGLDEACSIVLDDSINVYITGKSEGSGTGYDYATIKYDSAGIEQWVVRYDGLGNGTDEAYSIAIDGSNNVYVAGKSMGSGTDYDYATIKYVQGTGIKEEDGSEMEVRGPLLLTVTPNPFRETTVISFQCPVISEKEKITLSIYDVSGRLVKSFTLTTDHSALSTAVSWDGRDELGNEVQSGVYFCKLKSNHIERTCRIILLR